MSDGLLPWRKKDAAVVLLMRLDTEPVCDLLRAGPRVCMMEEGWRGPVVFG